MTSISSVGPSRGGLLARLAAWLDRGPQPPLRRAGLLFVGPPPAYALELARLVDARALVASTDGTDGAAAGEIVDREADAGCDLLALTSPAADPDLAVAAIAAFVGEEPVRAFGFDPLVPDQEWMTRVVAVRDGVRRVERSTDLPGALDALGDPALRGLTQALDRAVRRRTPVLLDGLPALAAAVLLVHYDELDVSFLQWAASVPAPAATAAGRVLGLAPLLDLGPAAPGVAAAVVLGIARAGLLIPAEDAP